MSISSAPSARAKAVSTVFTSRKVCEAGNPPLTQATLTLSAWRFWLTVPAKLGYTQMVASGGRSGCWSLQRFTLSVKLNTLSCESVTVSVVSSMVERRVWSTSGVLYFSRFWAMISFAVWLTFSSLSRISYLEKACWYWLSSSQWSSWPHWQSWWCPSWCSCPSWWQQHSCSSWWSWPHSQWCSDIVIVC